MRSTKRKIKIEQACKRSVKPKLQAGAGRWLLLMCEQDHLLRSIPYGDWSDARRKYGRKSAMVDCGRCATEVGNA